MRLTRGSAELPRRMPPTLVLLSLLILLPLLATLAQLMTIACNPNCPWWRELITYSSLPLIAGWLLVVLTLAYRALRRLMN